MIHKVNCRHCGRYLFEAVGSTVIQGFICPNSKCKAKMNIKVLFASDATHEQEHYEFSEEETAPRIVDSLDTNSQ